MATKPQVQSASPKNMARKILDAFERHRQIQPISSEIRGLDLDGAYRVAAEVMALRRARGERPIGRKIGFTNRNIWHEYGVFAPVWGYVYDATVSEIGNWDAAFPLSPYLEPRIEPEIVLGLARAPEPGMDNAALLDCIDWFAHGFEIVQSVYPAWRFQAVDTIAAFGLHGALVIGQKRTVTDPDVWLARLPNFEVGLFRDGALVDRGKGSNVLDGPLEALRHLVGMLTASRNVPALRPGEIVSTGTLTGAFPIEPGQRWHTEIYGLPLDGIALQFG